MWAGAYLPAAVVQVGVLAVVHEARGQVAADAAVVAVRYCGYCFAWVAADCVVAVADVHYLRPVVADVARVAD